MSCSYCKQKKAVAKCRSCDALLCGVNCLDVHVAEIGCTFHMRTAWKRAITNTEPKLETELQEDDLYMVFLYLRPGESLGGEKHTDTTQFFQVIQGSGTARIGDKIDAIEFNSMFFVPRDTYHDVTCANGTEPLRMITIYGKKNHTTE